MTTWSLEKIKGVNNSSAWVYETTLADGETSELLKIPGYNALTVTLIPAGGGAGSFYFATDKHSASTPAFELSTEFDAVIAQKTSSVFGVITWGKAVAAGGSVVARVLVR